MKKIILLTLAASLIGLCGCKNKNATSSFKEYKFDDVLSNTEKTDLIQHVKERLNGVSAVTSESYSKYETSNQKTEQTTKTNLSLYDCAHVHKETTTISNMVVDGITVKETNSSTYDRFNYVDKKTIVIYNTSDNTEEDNYSLNYYSDDAAETIDENVISNAVTDALPSISNLTAYKDGGGYALALSNIDEEYTAYEWGDSTKELHTISRSQTIIKISSSYLITSCYTYADVETNRDPGTGGWYKKDKQVYLATNNITVKYGGVGSGSSIRQNILSKFSNGFISYVSIGDAYGAFSFSIETTKSNPSHHHIKASSSTRNYGYYYGGLPFTLSVVTTYADAIRGESHADEKTPDFTIEGSGIQKDSEGGYTITSSAQYLYVEFDVDLYSWGNVSISNAKIYLL